MYYLFHEVVSCPEGNSPSVSTLPLQHRLATIQPVHHARLDCSGCGQNLVRPGCFCGCMKRTTREEQEQLSIRYLKHTVLTHACTSVLDLHPYNLHAFCVSKLKFSLSLIHTANISKQSLAILHQGDLKLALISTAIQLEENPLTVDRARYPSQHSSKDSFGFVGKGALNMFKISVFCWRIKI